MTSIANKGLTKKKANKGLTKKEVQEQKLEKEMKILIKIQAKYKKLNNNINAHILSLLNNLPDTYRQSDKSDMITIFENIDEEVAKPEYDLKLTDDEKIDIGPHVLKIDNYLISYRQFIKNESRTNKSNMKYLYDKTAAVTAAAATAATAATAAATTAAAAAAPAAAVTAAAVTAAVTAAVAADAKSAATIADSTFPPKRSMIALQFHHDFVKYTGDEKTKLYYHIQARIKKITQELGTSEMMKDYVKSRISNLLTEKVGEINIKPIADEIKKMSEEIRDLIPRTKSEHVGISMHKIRGGTQNRILWKNMFNKYNRNDLNLISKHYGLKNIEKVKNKRTIINNLNTIILYRSGKFNKRKELNSFSKLFGINPKLYKRKKDLIHKLNQTIS